MAALLLDVWLASGAAVGKHAPIGQRQLFQQSARLARLQGRDDDRDFVTRLDHVELPADPVEDARARALDRITPSRALPVAGGELDVDVRIVPFEAADGARELH